MLPEIESERQLRLCHALSLNCKAYASEHHGGQEQLSKLGREVIEQYFSKITVVAISEGIEEGKLGTGRAIGEMLQ